MIADFLPKMTNEESDYEEEQSENLIIVDNDVMLQNDAGDALFYDFVYNSFDEKVKFDIIFNEYSRFACRFVCGYGRNCEHREKPSGRS